jgi:hypothetical protein
LIRENTKDIDDQFVDLMVDFANKLEIHNFRFFQKVIKLYKVFCDELPTKVAYSTKKIILTRVLQGYLIVDYGNSLRINWDDFTTENFIEIYDEIQKDELNDIKLKTLKKLYGISFDIFSDYEGWFVQFKDWFEQRDSLDLSVLHRLANSELISEENNKNKEELGQLMNQWRNLAIDQNYCDQLFKKSRASIKFNSLSNLEFHCFYLKSLVGMIFLEF